MCRNAATGTVGIGGLTKSTQKKKKTRANSIRFLNVPLNIFIAVERQFIRREEGWMVVDGNESVTVTVVF